MLGVGVCPIGTNSFASGERPDEGDVVIVVKYSRGLKFNEDKIVMTSVCLLFGLREEKE